MALVVCGHVRVITDLGADPSSDANQSDLLR
jgi:hypothetical protein